MKVPFCRIVEPFNECEPHKEGELLQATMTNMNMCVRETCYFHLVEYLGNIVKTNKQKKTKQVNNKPKQQQLNNKNKSRENKQKYIFESKELINVNKQTKEKKVGCFGGTVGVWRQCCQPGSTGAARVPRGQLKM